MSKNGLVQGLSAERNSQRFFVFGASAFGVSEGPLLDVLSLVFRLGPRRRHTEDEAHGGAMWIRDGNGSGHMCERCL